MPKKIYDIVPPKAKHPAWRQAGKTAVVKKITASEEKNLPAAPRHAEHTAKKSHKEVRRHKAVNFSWTKVLAVVGSAIVLALAIFFYFKLQKADIEIWPKTETLSFSQKIIADKSVDFIDINKNTIPAQLLEEEKDLSQEFSSSGQAQNDSKAKGAVKVFNSYEPFSPITLVAGTHLLSDSGKYFITLKKITVPAAKKVSGKIVLGSVDAAVEAKNTGSDYNVGPSKFSFPKLAGTPYYYSIFASSSGSMAGGFEKNVKLVTDGDIQNAKDTLVKKLLNDAEAGLRSKISSDQVLFDNGIITAIVEALPSVKSGATAEKFNYQAKVKATALVFKKQDLEKLTKDYILFQTQDSKIILDKSFSINYTPDLLDIKGGKIILNSNFSAKIYQTINKDSLTILVSRKTQDEVINIINSNIGDSISLVKVNFWPFWTQKTPGDAGKVKINLNFD
ncbi:MAG: hypothetical protein AAB352_02565 [Patescibacteria group bacterium]